MGEFSIGQAVTRLEDPKLLRGQGRYLDDLNLDRQLWAVLVRSPHAHADILSISTDAAKDAPGVHAVLTGADYRVTRDKIDGGRRLVVTFTRPEAMSGSTEPRKQ